MCFHKGIKFQIQIDVLKDFQILRCSWYIKHSCCEWRGITHWSRLIWTKRARPQLLCLSRRKMCYSMCMWHYHIAQLSANGNMYDPILCTVDTFIKCLKGYQNQLAQWDEESSSKADCCSTTSSSKGDQTLTWMTWMSLSLNVPKRAMGPTLNLWTT